MKLTRLAICFALTLITAVASAQTDTTFTFQGELNENGTPANGLFSIDFELWDAAAGGNQIGTTNENNDVPVVNGRFTVELDFGASAFDNSDRWLEIEVNGGTLSPRTPLTRAPYAIQTRGIFVDEDENVGIGTSNPVWELEVANPTAGDGAAIGITADDTGGAFAAYSSTFAFPHLADRVSLFSHAFDSSGLDLRADGGTSDIRFYTGGFAETNERMRITADGSVGIGKSVPGAKLEVFSQTHARAVEVTSSIGGAASVGVFAASWASSGTGIIVIADSGSDPCGIWAYSPSGEAGHFTGDVNVVGTLAKSAGSFKIDHPLDPENKYLSHSFVESPDMMNVYNGNIVTDADGYATVPLPEWFEVLNREFRYQLTIIDAANSDTFVLAKVVEEIRNNQFKIRTSVPNTKVSWQVTGIRQDPYAEANRIPVEEMKPTELRGLFRHPELYGRTPEFREDSIKLSAMQRERPESNEAVEQVTKHPNHQKSNQE